MQSKGLTKEAEEDPFDSITDKIPERPVSVAEGASYSLVILAGLAVAGFAAYSVLKELIFEPKEYVKLYSVCTLVYAGRIIVYIPLWQNYATSQLHQG